MPLSGNPAASSRSMMRSAMSRLFAMQNADFTMTRRGLHLRVRFDFEMVGKMRCVCMLLRSLQNAHLFLRRIHQTAEGDLSIDRDHLDILGRPRDRGIFDQRSANLLRELHISRKIGLGLRRRCFITSASAGFWLCLRWSLRRNEHGTTRAERK